MTDYFGHIGDTAYFIPLFSDTLTALTPDGTLHPVCSMGIGDQISHEGISVQHITSNAYSYFMNFHICDNGTYICTTQKGDQVIDVIGNLHTGDLRTANDQIVRGAYRDYFILFTRTGGSFEQVKRLHRKAEENPVLVLLDTRRIPFQ